MRATGKVDEILNKVVDEIHGTGRQGLAPDATQRRNRRDVELKVNAIFPFVGFTPHSISSTTSLPTDRARRRGHIDTDHTMHTCVPGIYAAGDVRSQFVQQITNAVGDATTPRWPRTPTSRTSSTPRSKQAA